MSVTYQSPGVYIENVNRGTKPIEGVGTAVAAFVGFTAKAEGSAKNGDGPVTLLNKATKVTNWSQYERHFGSFVEEAFLPNAVYGYFANGGGQCYIISLDTLQTSPDPALAKPAQVALTGADAAGQTPNLVIKARQAGPAGNDLSVTIRHDKPQSAKEQKGNNASDDSEEAQTFSLTINQAGSVAETFSGLGVEMGEQNVVSQIKTRSALIEVEQMPKKSKPPFTLPAEGDYALTGGEIQSRTITAPDFEGNPARREGLGALAALDDVTMVCVPDLMSSYLRGDIDLKGVEAVQQMLLAHCQHMRYRFAILDAPPNMSPQEILDWRTKEANFDSRYGALYYPWIAVSDPLGKQGQIMMPPSGHIAGLYARTDNERGVHKAPANDVILGALDLEINITKEEQDDLNPVGINCIRAFPGRGIRVWGARTLSSDGSWKYINVRRLFNFVEASIEAGTQWVVFEPNDQDLWGRVTRDVRSFLRRIHRSGALFGKTPEEAFYVKCDGELNPPEVRDAGQLIIEVGLAPVKPAEFVIFRISQWTGPDAEGAA